MRRLVKAIRRADSTFPVGSNVLLLFALYWTAFCPVHDKVRLRAATSVPHLKCQALCAVTGTGRLLDPEKCFLLRLPSTISL